MASIEDLVWVIRGRGTLGHAALALAWMLPVTNRFPRCKTLDKSRALSILVCGPVLGAVDLVLLISTGHGMMYAPKPHPLTVHTSIHSYMRSRGRWPGGQASVHHTRIFFKQLLVVLLVLHVNAHTHTQRTTHTLRISHWFPPPRLPTPSPSLFLTRHCPHASFLFFYISSRSVEVVSTIPSRTSYGADGSEPNHRARPPYSTFDLTQSSRSSLMLIES